MLATTSKLKLAIHTANFVPRVMMPSAPYKLLPASLPPVSIFIAADRLSRRRGKFRRRRKLCRIPPELLNLRNSRRKMRRSL
jgi:hypothetical protein